MKWLQFVTVSVLAAFASFAEVTRDTEWQDVPDTTKVGTVLDLGSGNIDSNAVRSIVRPMIADATNALRLCDGAARPLPRYLHALDFADSYPDAAAAYYRSRGNGKTDGGCSAVRDGGYLSRNFDFPFDGRSEFVVRMSAGPNRFASVGVAQVGTNLTEEIVTSGKPSRCYKWLPGATVDGINEHGVVCEINVVDGDPQTSGWHTNATIEAIHPLGAVRCILDTATNAQHGAEYIAANIRFPAGWTQNFHYMIADAENTYIVENGVVGNTQDWSNPAITNYKCVDNHGQYDPHVYEGGQGTERLSFLREQYDLLFAITNAWFTNAYRRETNPPWVSDLEEVLAYTNDIYNAWASHPKEYFRNKTNGGEPWWQTVHTSIYDIPNRVLRVAVQETDDWYTFAVPSAGTDEAKVRAIAQDEIAKIPPFEEQDPTATAKANEAIAASPVVGGKIDSAYYDGIRTNRYEWVGGGFRFSSGSGLLEWHREDGFGISFENTGILLQPIDPAQLIWYRGDDWYYLSLPRTNGTLAVVSQIDDATNGLVSASNPTFSNAVNASVADYAAVSNAAMNAVSNSAYDAKLYWTKGDHTEEVDTVLHAKNAIFRADYVVADDNISTHLLFAENIVAQGYGARITLYDAGTKEFHDLKKKADRSMISATNETFAAEVLKVHVATLSTNITAEVYIAATNACANLGINPALIPGEGTVGTVGGFIAMLFAVVFWMKRKIFDNSGKVNDTFANDLLGKSVASQKIDERLPIPISAKSAGFTTESHKRFVVTVSGDMTLTLHTPTSGDAEIFECRFDGASLSADASVSFTGATVTKMEGETDTGVVKAGKVALMSAFWNGTTWDVNWKVEG